MSINSASSGGTAPLTLFTSPVEYGNYSATAATGTINVDLLTSSFWYYTTNASGNFVFNFRGNSSTTLNSSLSVGQSITATFAVKNGGTAYYATSITIDGNAQTVLWQGGAAPTAGNVSATDLYTFTIMKTATTPTYTVLGTITRFA